MSFRTFSVRAITFAWCIIITPAFSQWQKLEPMPQPSAGFVCGADGDGVVVIGGTNWQAGTKNWLSDINRFAPQAGRWSVVGKLSEPLAYAVCDTRRSDGALVILGGSNGEAPIQAVMVMHKTQVSSEPAQALPREIVLSAGGIIDDDFIVVGGTDDAANIAGFTRRAFAWNLKSRTCTPLPYYPGHPVGMAAAAVLRRAVGLWRANPTNGIANTAEAFAYSHKAKQWRRLKPCPIAARGAAAVALDEHRIYLAGGYGGTPESFLNRAFIYDVRTDSYAPALPLPYAATASLIKVGDFVYCVGGEDNMKSRTDAAWRIPVAALSSPQ